MVLDVQQEIGHRASPDPPLLAQSKRSGLQAFSKKVENHVHSLALFSTYYNFVKVHSKLRMSPAIAAGVADRLRTSAKS